MSSTAAGLVPVVLGNVGVLVMALASDVDVEDPIVCVGYSQSVGVEACASTSVRMLA